MNWIKNNPIKSILIALAIIYVIISLFRGWNPLKWFASAGSTTTRTTTTIETTDGSAPFSDTLNALKKSLGNFQVSSN